MRSAALSNTLLEPRLDEPEKRLCLRALPSCFQLPFELGATPASRTELLDQSLHEAELRVPPLLDQGRRVEVQGDGEILLVFRSRTVNLAGARVTNRARYGLRARVDGPRGRFLMYRISWRERLAKFPGG